MKRRSFLRNVGAGVASGAVLSFPQAMQAAQQRSAQQNAAAERMRERPQGRLKISGVEVVRVQGRVEELVGVNDQRQVNALSGAYEEYKPKEYRETGPGRKELQPYSANYLIIKTDQGLEGRYGPVDSEAARVVLAQLKSFLMGKDALAVETLWDQMFRSNRHSRAGHFLMAISAVDCALWDLRGRYFQAPVYRLLGGPTRPRAQVYGSTLGFSAEKGKAGPRAAELERQGYNHQKWFMPYGPSNGPEGLIMNVELVRELREAVGDNVDLMFDAYSGWDLNYTLAWARQVEQYRPRWIEESSHVDKLTAFVELSRATSIPVATGEHFYGRWEVMEFLREGAITVVQADPEWCGGVSELVKICAIGSAFDAHVIPHGHGVLASLHVVASQSPMTCPLVEYLINKMETYYHFETNPPRPVNGYLELPEEPGFGTELDASKVEKQGPFAS